MKQPNSTSAWVGSDRITHTPTQIKLLGTFQEAEFGMQPYQDQTRWKIRGHAWYAAILNPAP